MQPSSLSNLFQKANSQAPISRNSQQENPSLSSMFQNASNLKQEKEAERRLKIDALISSYAPKILEAAREDSDPVRRQNFLNLEIKMSRSCSEASIPYGDFLYFAKMHVENNETIHPLYKCRIENYINVTHKILRLNDGKLATPKETVVKSQPQMYVGIKEAIPVGGEFDSNNLHERENLLDYNKFLKLTTSQSISCFLCSKGEEGVDAHWIDHDHVMHYVSFKQLQSTNKILEKIYDTLKINSKHILTFVEGRGIGQDIFPTDPLVDVFISIQWAETSNIQSLLSSRQLTQAGKAHLGDPRRFIKNYAKGVEKKSNDETSKEPAIKRVIYSCYDGYLIDTGQQFTVTRRK